MFETTPEREAREATDRQIADRATSIIVWLCAAAAAAMACFL